MDGRQQQQTPNSAIGRSRQSGAALVALPVGARRVLPSMLDEIQSALGDQLLGVYLYGSVVGGDFDEGVSDIDLVVAFAGAVDQSMMGRLETAHYRFWQTHPDFVDRIDLVYAPAAVLSGRPPSDGGSSGLPLLASVSPGSPLHTTSATRSWALNWQQARDAGATLTGRPVESVVRPVPVDEVRAVVAAEALSLRERIPETHHRGGHAYLVLTACRAVFTMTTGGQVGKAEAARWASSRWPHLRPAIDAALEWRRTQAVRDETPVPTELAAQIADLLTIGETMAGKADRSTPTGH